MIGDISPAVKRFVAGFLPKNDAQQKQRFQGPKLATVGESKLSDTVHSLAANLNRLMDRERARGAGLGSNEGLAKAAGVSSNTVARMRRGDGSATVIKISKIARVLRVQVWELVFPGFDPMLPPEVAKNQAERDLLRAFRNQPPPTQH